MSKREVQRTLNKAKNTGFSLDDDRATLWLAQNLSKIQTSMKQNEFVRDSKTLIKDKNLTPGVMVFFGYNPKTKDSLPFWDEFPVTIVIDPAPGGFLGLNLHYLPPPERSRFLNILLKKVSDQNWHVNPHSDAKFKINYAFLKATEKLSPFKRCIKRYYYSNILTKVALIEPMRWKSVPFFPLDKFRGASRTDIWKLA